MDQTKVSFQIHTGDKKSHFLQNKVISKNKLGLFSFAIETENGYQIYFLEKEVANIEKQFVQYRSPLNFLFKLCLSKNDNSIIGVLLGDGVDSGLEANNGKIKLSRKDNHLKGLFHIDISQGSGEDITLKGYLSAEIFPEYENHVYLKNYENNLNIGKSISFCISDIDGQEIIQTNLYAGFLFPPAKDLYQITFLTSQTEDINILNYRFIKKEVSLLFYKENNSNLNYFFTTLLGPSIFLFKEDLDSMEGKFFIDYIDSESDYGKIVIDFDFKFHSRELKKDLCVKMSGELTTLCYPRV